MGLLRTHEATPEPAPAPRDVAACLLDLRDGDPWVRRAAALDLGGEAAAVPALLATLTTADDPQLRSAILSALVETGGPDVAEGLAALLRDADVGLRNAAAQALRRMPADARAPLLRRLATQDADLRIAVLTILVDIPNDGTELRALLARESEATVVFAAIEALAACGMPDDVPFLDALARRFPAEPSIAFAVSLACRSLERRA